MAQATRSQDRTETARRHEILVVLALCLLAAARVFVYSAAFPFYNNVDEQMHFDLVDKYSVGHVPAKEIEPFGPRAAELIVLYGTPEYFHGPARFPGGRVPPPAWTMPDVRSTAQYREAVSHWQGKGNHESASFPAYYALAGLWAAAGRAAGLAGGAFLYWIRFLNVPLIVALVCLSYLIGRTFAAEHPLQRLGLPLLAAFFPQDSFYSINSDALSPVLFALCLFMLIQICFENRSVLYHAVAGLAAAACLLVKMSNLAVLMLLALVVAVKGRRLRSERRLREYLPRLAVLLLASLAPIGLWAARNRLLFGDLSGSSLKAEHLGWTFKSMGQWWDHPIFTASGLLTFLRGLTETFWRGEFVWHLERIRSPWMDLFYVSSSAVFLGVSLLALAAGRTGSTARHRLLIAASFGAVSVSVLLLAALSIVFDFGNCWFPSREVPYFLAGRLILCVLPPFLVLYVEGLGRLLPAKNRTIAAFAILSIIALAITISEWMITRDVFASPYNWFHLRG
jgi:hypothetical protein